MTPAMLAAIHKDAFNKFRHWSEDEFAALTAQKGVAVCGDEAGFALIRVTLDEAELLTIATKPAQRRQGHGQRNLTKAEAVARTAGATMLFLEVAEDNHAACALYVKAGYAQVGRRPDYYQKKGELPVAALVMRKALDDIKPASHIQILRNS